MRQRWHYLGCEHKRRSSSTPRAVRWAIAHGVCRCSMSHSDRISHGGGMVVVVVTIGRDRVLWQPVCIPSLIPMSCSCSCTCCSFCSFCSWYHLPLSTAGVPHHPTQKERNTPPKLASCKVNCCYGEQMKPISAPPHHQGASIYCCVSRRSQNVSPSTMESDEEEEVGCLKLYT
jgi:hypothetical protein